MYGTYVFGQSWISVGLCDHWVVCTVNCGSTHYYTILMLILCITVYTILMMILRITDLVSCDVECASCSYALIVETVKVFL